jgi:protein tyrosine phosphatase (PTP) superfamily phosphohydrolase (DUF442 family)
LADGPEASAMAGGSSSAAVGVVQASRFRAVVADALRIAGIACLLMLAAEGVYVVFDDNLHSVIPQQVYRSAQLDAPTLERVVSRYGIRSVLNLRGHCPGEAWYQAESNVLRRREVAQYDVALSSSMVPGVSEMRNLVGVLETAERPLLIHCRRGSDRTGLVCAMGLLLQEGTPPRQALGQLSWRYGHVPFGSTGRLRWVLDWYQEWLAETRQEHTPARFRDWATRVYRPGPYWARLEPLEVPTQLPLGRRLAARFRVHNCSRYPWRFTRAASYGFHLRYLLRTKDRALAYTGGAGYREETLWPGQSIELTLSLPAVRRPGRYELLVDMAEDSATWFSLLGSPAYRTELTVAAE